MSKYITQVSILDRRGFHPCLTKDDIKMANVATKFCAVEQLEDCKAEFRAELGIEPNRIGETAATRNRPSGMYVSFNRDAAPSFSAEDIKANFVLPTQS